MKEGDLKWIIVDLTTGKLDGFYLIEQMAEDAMKSWQDQFPSRQFVLAEIHATTSRKLSISDSLWLGTEEH